MTDPSSPGLLKHFHRYLWPGWWVLMFVATHLPKPPGLPVEIHGGDKVIHFLLYFVLTMLGGQALIAARRVRGFSTLLAWAGVYLLYAAVDEWLQKLEFVNRTPSIHDWLADVVGVIAATLILSTFRIDSGKDEQDTAGSRDE